METKVRGAAVRRDDSVTRKDPKGAETEMDGELWLIPVDLLTGIQLKYQPFVGA